MTRLLAFLAFGLFFYLCARLQPKDAPEPEVAPEPEQLTSELIVEDYPWPERWRCADGRGVVTMEAQSFGEGNDETNANMVKRRH